MLITHFCKNKQTNQLKHFRGNPWGFYLYLYLFFGNCLQELQLLTSTWWEVFITRSECSLSGAQMSPGVWLSCKMDIVFYQAHTAEGFFFSFLSGVEDEDIFYSQQHVSLLDIKVSFHISRDMFSCDGKMPSECVITVLRPLSVVSNIRPSRLTSGNALFIAHC